MPSTASPLPSATVMLVRDLPHFEVLMVRRHHQIDFASGALVFPGGKVDPEDREPAWKAHVVVPPGLTEDERACRICAMREVFEESAILLGHDPAGPDLPLEIEAAAHRAEVAAGRNTFRGLVERLGLKLDLGAMTLFAHWVTPAAMPKRFDTRFYLMSAPADQLAACDGYETVDAEWVAPAEALRLQQAGERTVLFPTRQNLRLLAESGSAKAALADAARRRVVRVEPTVDRRPDGMHLTIPPDAGYGIVPPQLL